MNKVIRIAAALPGLLFVVMGLRWLVDPAGAAAGLGMPLLDGLALSSQMGDTGSFFLVGGGMILYAAVTLQRTWYYAPALLVAMVAVFRLVAWQFHGAVLATEMITAELVITALLLLAAVKVGKP